jgi:hypothetical protein
MPFCVYLQLLNTLRDLRSIISGEVLDTACNHLKQKLHPTILRKIEGSSAQASTGKLRGIVKSIILLGANLSQSREFRDLFEDVVTKVHIPPSKSH